ncbi:MAG TPA: MGMT family protein [Chitinophaga sp.]|uniref:MGMT family protein n=1 Tax=Chitinophaga sp. TaxID=1869181 RepID=UPI002B6656B3|nr:MGMT family protein [Chitinophaga sp.]HVI44548.1 MGMT family protein [Chitinophaga sp.]
MKTYQSPKELPSSKKGVTKKTEKKTNESPSFFDTVYKIVRKIPRGRVTSYGAIAEASGIRLTARMVGWAMHGAGSAKPAVPAHRVVNSSGILSGRHHFATPTLMQDLLEQEGITVKGDKIINFKEVFWDPGEKKSRKVIRKKLS